MKITDLPPLFPERYCEKHGYKQGKTRQGTRYCKPCRSEYAKKYYENKPRHRARLAVNHRIWQKKHKDRVKIYQKLYRIRKETDLIEKEIKT